MPKRNIIWVLAIVAAALATLWATRKGPVPLGTPQGDSFQPVEQTYQLIKQHYYQPVDDAKLSRAAVSGMVEALDPFSAYIPPEQAEAIERRVTRGLARGVGLELELAEGQVRIADVQANSPAHRAGLLPGEQVVEIDGKELEDLPLRAVEDLLKGPLGGAVTLAVAGGGKGRTVALKREEYPVETVQGLYRDGGGQWVHQLSVETGLGYIRIREFVEDTEHQFQSIFRQLGGPRGLVLDLRDNPGGSLESAVAVCDLFLSEGVIVTTVGRDGVPLRHTAHRTGGLPDVPVVVLINGRTTSAAEIVAGALRQHNRAVLVGTRSRGKGCVQSVLPLAGGLGKMSLTTSVFYLGRYGSISRQPGSDRWGVDPHVQVVLLASNEQRLSSLRRLFCTFRPPQPAPQTLTSRPVSILADFLKADPQLAQAAQLLAQPKEMQAILARAAEEAKDEPAAAEGPADHD